MTLSGEEFLRRFLVHVLPKGFVKIRHYGLLANRRREERLATCRRLLALLAPPTATTAADNEATKTDAALDPAETPHCPHCGGRRFVYFELPAERCDPVRSDTS